MLAAHGRPVFCAIVQRKTDRYLTFRNQPGAARATSRIAVMAITHVTPVAPFGAITTFRIASIVERAVQAVQDVFTAAHTRQQLSRLTPRQLADIGLTDASLAPVDLDEVSRMLAAGRR